jgi:hypothetical protein
MRKRINEKALKNVKVFKVEKKKQAVNTHEEILKKDHTYDNNGNLLEVKQVRADYLPNLNTQNARMDIRDDFQTQISEVNKKLKTK